MFSQFSDLTIILFLIIAALVPSCLIMFIHIISLNKKIKRLDERVLMINYYIEKNNNDIKDTIEELNKKEDKINDDLNKKFDHLSSSTTAVIRILREEQQNPPTHMPRPNEVKEIESTIQDQLSIEIMKSLDLNAPNEDYIVKIATNVANTYPEIDRDYIGNKTTAYIEAFIKNNNMK